MKCNKCGGPLEVEGDAKGQYGLITSITGSYFSPKLNDLTRYKFAICEYCLAEMFESEFEIPPEEGEVTVEGYPIETKDVHLEKIREIKSALKSVRGWCSMATSLECFEELREIDKAIDPVMEKVESIIKKHTMLKALE